MDFYTKLSLLNPRLQSLFRQVNDPTIDPAIRQQVSQHILSRLRNKLKDKAYSMLAFDLMIEETAPPALDPRLSAGMAKQNADSIALGNTRDNQDEIFTSLMQAIDQAQQAAFERAGALGRERKLIRRIVSETCSWCRDLEGVHYDPQPEHFMRHKRCDCLMQVTGYRSRNGTVANYRNDDRE